MALTRDSSGGGKAVSAPRRTPPAPPQSRSVPRAAPASPQRPAVAAPSRARAAAPAPRALPRARPAPAPRPAPQIVKRPEPAVDVIAKYNKPVNDLTALFERKPMKVEVAPEKPEPSLDSWINVGIRRGPSVVPVQRERRQARAQVDSAARSYEAMARMGKRDQKRRVLEKNDRQETAQELTAEQWANYTPMQQAAIQANADLVQAIQRDFDPKTRHQASREQVQGYQDRVKELFGENGSVGYKGLEFAPNTLAWIDSRGLKAADLAGKTLDHFLSGDALMSMDDVESLETGKPRAYRGRNLDFAKRLAKGQMAFQEQFAAKLQKGEQLLTEITSDATNTTAGASYGANTEATQIVMDKVRPELLGQFDKYLQVLARTDIEPESALESITLDLEQWGASPDETQQIWEGLTQRTRHAAVGSDDWFPEADIELRSPIVVSQLLGVPTLKRQSMQTKEP